MVGQESVAKAVTSGLGNYKTTIAGTAAAPALYLSLVGEHAPQTPQEWGIFAVSLLLWVLSYFAKDATTGSQPGGPAT